MPTGDTTQPEGSDSGRWRVDPLATSTITALPAAPVTEGGYAVAAYSISPGLAGSASVSVSLSGWGATAADYAGLDYSLDGGSTWLAVPPGGALSLAAGQATLHLRTAVLADAFSESGEMLQFVVAQSPASSLLVNSWWVTSNIALMDPPSAPTGAPSTITALPTSPATEGTDAMAVFTLDNPLALASDVVLSLSGWGSTLADYSGFMVRTTVAGVTGAWAAVPPGGVFTLDVGTTQIELKTSVLTDSDSPESGEALAFVLSQTGYSGSLMNSWWVPALVSLVDVPAGGGPPPGPGASSTQITVSGSPLMVTEGTDSYAVSQFSLGAALAQDAQVYTYLHGWSAILGTDTSGFQYRTGTDSTVGLASWASVPPDWAVTIPAGDTRLELRTAITDDLLHETDENLVFVVQQNSANLVNSWWVHQTAVIHDNDSLAPGGPGFSPSRITAGSTPQVDEGQAAVASYSLDHALQGDAQISVAVLGWSAQAGSDFDASLAYRLYDGSVWGSWVATSNLAQVTLLQGTTGFELKTQTLTDAVSPEYTETLEFVVSQSASATYLHDSWWQSALVGVVDVAPVV